MKPSFSKDAKLRYDQAMVDADIEGMARDLEVEAFVREMDKQGLRADLRIKRLKAFLTERRMVPAAE